MFSFFYKTIIFRLNKEKEGIRSLYVFFYKTLKSYNLEIANHIAYVIFVFYGTMKTHLLTNQNARTTQIVL